MSGVIASIQLYCIVRLMWSVFLPASWSKLQSSLNLTYEIQQHIKSNRAAQWQSCKACVSHTFSTAVYIWQEYNCHTLLTPWSQICDPGVDPATYLRGQEPQRGKRSKKHAFSQNTLCPTNYTHIFMQKLSCEFPQTYALSAVNSITPPKRNM